ncbi:MAG: response regulator transcription factor [Candidatus Melainabacteria bacterium]|nr:response regulator transcription factor [Candidatus Melainabacteria bacterium]
MKLLLVEDDENMASTILSWLRADRYEVIHSADGLEGFDLLKNGTFDAAILDFELPGITGLEICRQYRAIKGVVPILMLTGRSQVADRIDGLDAGADDYLTKPFSLKELSARLRALIRRPAAVVSSTLKVGELTLDPIKHRVTRRGSEVQLMPREFSLLEFFMRNADMVFSPEALLQRVWPNDADATPDALRNAIKRLRKKLDDGEDETASLIENIPRVGYRLRNPD